MKKRLRPNDRTTRLRSPPAQGSARFRSNQRRAAPIVADTRTYAADFVRHTRKRHSRITSLRVRRDFFLYISRRSVTIRGTPQRDNPSRFAPPGGLAASPAKQQPQPESTSDESCKEITNRRARRAFARHGKPVLCAERCALYRRARMACHDGQNKARHG